MSENSQSFSTTVTSLHRSHLSNQIMVNIRKPDVWNTSEVISPKLTREWIGKQFSSWQCYLRVDPLIAFPKLKVPEKGRTARAL